MVAIILCFDDSNVWGAIPGSFIPKRPRGKEACFIVRRKTCDTNATLI
jgi:hypothetical protein